MRAIILHLCAMCFLLAPPDGFSGISPNKRESSGDARGGHPVLPGLPNSTLCNINNISAWYDDDGIQEHHSSTSNSGLTFPRQTAKAVYGAGLMWGGLFQDGRLPALRVNGQCYNTGMQRGAILGTRTGVAEDPDAPDVRIWRVRRDYFTADLTLDAAEYFNVPPGIVTQQQIDEVRAQYETDWMEWPAHKGAPFYDSDGDGIYSPEFSMGEPILYPDADEPGLAEGDQVLWYVCNDLTDQPWTNVQSGIEEQTTIWGYDQSDAIGNTILKRFRMIYKGVVSTPENATIDSLYICQWSDPDVGSFGDDFAGCDTVLSLGYAYNGEPMDDQYAGFGLAPPAIGYDFLQGPLVFTGNSVDTAIFDFRKISGARNLPMTSFIYFSAGGTYYDPPFNADGGIQWYQMLRGLPPTPQGPPDPLPPIDPYTGLPAGPFWLYAGSDGVSAPSPQFPNGWVDGMLEAPGDRRFLLSSGPFTMALGDTQEIVIATVLGIASSYLQSVQTLKFNDVQVQNFYNSLAGIVTSVEPSTGETPGAFTLLQNYPNPFNPSTKIEFVLRQSSFVNLVIHDLLGREVATLVNERLTPGRYSQVWDASGMTSGVYYYRLRSGDFVQTRKLILLR